MGRSWQSEPGESLTVSWLFCSLEPQQLQWLPLAAGMALHQSLESQLGQQAGLFVKWPNDLVGRQADGSFKKLAGILCESRSGERSFAVCGIGINLCQPASFFEQAGLPDAGSVAQVFCCVPDAYQLHAGDIRHLPEFAKLATFTKSRSQAAAGCLLCPLHYVRQTGLHLPGRADANGSESHSH